MTRSRLFLLALSGVALLATAAFSQAWQAAPPARDAAAPPAPGRDPADVGLRFTGHSASGDFQAALEDARFQADQYFAQFGADILVHYRVLGTTGRRGGFAGFNDIYVTIAAQAEGL